MIAYEYAQRKFAHLEGLEKEEAIQDFIRCYSMPSHFNSTTTKSIARDLAKELGVHFVEYPIQKAFDSEVEAENCCLEKKFLQ